LLATEHDNIKARVFIETVVQVADAAVFALERNRIEYLAVRTLQNRWGKYCFAVILERVIVFQILRIVIVIGFITFWWWTDDAFHVILATSRIRKFIFLGIKVVIVDIHRT